MAETSAIAWTHATFNPWLGCTKVSEACAHCYAERDRAVAAASKRVGSELWGPSAARVVTSDAYWKQPIRWNRDAEAAGERRRVFSASLADVFEDRRDLDAPRARLFDLILETPHLDWLLLTKRPHHARTFVPSWWAHDGWPSNVWLGTTVENQERAEERIPHLLRVPARVRFLSCEPLLGPIDLRRWVMPPHGLCASCDAGLPASCQCPDSISWVIVGGESGHGARPMHPEWALDLRDQCKSSSVPFFFKQWGEWAPEEMNGFLDAEDAGKLVEQVCTASTNPAHVGRSFQAIPSTAHDAPGDFWVMRRVGKKAAGALLDGREWQEFPA